MFDEPLLKSFLSLCSVVAVLAVALFFVKKYAKKARIKHNGMDLSVLSRTSLQPKSHLYIVQAGAKTLLLGVSDHSITTLSDLTEDKNKSSFVPAKQPQQQTKTVVPLIQPVAVPVNKQGNPLSFRNFLSAIVKKENGVN